MRTSKTISISMSPAQHEEVALLAKKENRTMSELVREALRQYQQTREQEEHRIDIELLEALRAVQEDAARKGLSSVSMSEIDAEIRAHRKDKRSRRNQLQPAR